MHGLLVACHCVERWFAVSCLSSTWLLWASFLIGLAFPMLGHKLYIALRGKEV